MSLVVGVHGIAKHHFGRHQLLAGWRPALLDGLERATGQRIDKVDLDLAFYGDFFLPSKSSVGHKSTDSDDVLHNMSDGERADIESVLSEMVTAAELAAAAEELAQQKSYTRTPTLVQLLLRAVGRRFTLASAVTTVGVMRQVRRYLHDATLKDEIDQRVKDSVASDCRILISHSLGSVVALEYLRHNSDHDISVLLTMGSPLGLRFIRSRLPATPVTVPKWVNITDRHDPVACAGPLRTWWSQISEADELVVDNGGDAHAVERYLSRKATGRALLSAFPDIDSR
ncbi:hypothetical protein [Lentzea aerocolonigenes]|uniref:hypothetical protein n=1 Tax=Lentzea aerocolonigenes TaxID=68170 RepID=UPI0004C3A79E|nr:hypothetical protein [Lentzea aerocolonigenes]